MHETRWNQDIDLNKPAREFMIGAAAGIVLAGLVALPVVIYADRRGKRRALEEERTRMLSREEAVRTRPLASRPALPGRPEDSRGGGALSPSETGEPEGEAPFEPPSGPRGPRCFTPDECVRIVWPMEIVDHDTEPGKLMFRVRQGANRLARPGTGLAEFAFRAHRPVALSVYLRLRHSDECGNSVVCAVDGGGGASVGGTKLFGRWTWECAKRRFAVGPGLHRLTVFTREDGVEFDRVVVSAKAPDPRGPAGPEARAARGVPASAYLSKIAPTAAPVFESLPVASEILPRVGPVTAEVMPTRSLVAGRGHRNTLTVFTRLNGPDAKTVRITARGAVCRRARHEIRLSPRRRMRLTEVEILGLPPGGYLRPVTVEVCADGVRVHSRVVNFVNPLDWAFVGPFPDPERKGLGLELPPDRLTEGLHLLPDLSSPAAAACEWIPVTDGSCYDELGVVDLNRVFGYENVPWSEKGNGCEPKVAYAVTCLPSAGARHACFAYAADDCLRVWINGRPVLSQEGNAPLETTRQVIGTKLEKGLNVFVFKVPQTGYHWQLVFEPDTTFPYSHPGAFYPLPMKAWRHFGKPEE